MSLIRKEVMVFMDGDVMQWYYQKHDVDPDRDDCDDQKQLDESTIRRCRELLLLPY